MGAAGVAATVSPAAVAPTMAARAIRIATRNRDIDPLILLITASSADLPVPAADRVTDTPETYHSK